MGDLSFFPAERNRYFFGKLLTVRDFETEQNYFNIKRRLINRIVHGPGVVCGLGVTVSDDTTLIIESGMALDYMGREIVLDQPLVRKLEMIEGQELLKGRSDTYLCLAYDEKGEEPVNAVGEDGSQTQNSITREGHRLFFASEMPDLRSMLEAQGCGNVSVVYSSDDLTIALHLPEAICAGDDFAINALIVKNDGGGPVRFKLEGDSEVAESEDGRIALEYTQSPSDSRNVIETSFLFKAQNITDSAMQLFPGDVELNVELGSHRYRNFIELNAECFICTDLGSLRDHQRKTDTLARHMLGKQLPIYLAKIELLNSTGRVFLGKSTNLPFNQEVTGNNAMQSSAVDLEVSTSVRTLEYWQKPDVNSTFNRSTGKLHMDFGIPTAEIYDYSTSHGIVEIPVPGGIKVNTRLVSDEIPHGLGAGNVDVRLSIEYEDSNKQVAHMFGSSEVFKGKLTGVKAPPFEVAAVVYPVRGTMRVGVWLHDDVDVNMLHIHYYAQKPERDTKRILENRDVSISIVPEIARVVRRGKTRLKAVVVGSEDKGVIWKIKDDAGGEISSNGAYQAPEIAGTYEVLAYASADEKVVASAFVIVE